MMYLGSESSHCLGTFASLLVYTSKSKEHDSFNNGRKVTFQRWIGKTGVREINAHVPNDEIIDDTNISVPTHLNANLHLQ